MESTTKPFTKEEILKLMAKGYVPIKAQHMINPDRFRTSAISSSSSSASSEQSNPIKEMDMTSSSESQGTKRKFDEVEEIKDSDSLANTDDAEEAATAHSEPPAKKQKREKDKSRRGQNKNKDREFYKVNEIKLCFATKFGLQCQAQNCKYSHDIAAYIASKGEDLSQYLFQKPKKCPLMEATGFCRFGITCRFSDAHFDAETKTNLLPMPTTTATTENKDQQPSQTPTAPTTETEAKTTTPETTETTTETASTDFSKVDDFTLPPNESNFIPFKQSFQYQKHDNKKLNQILPRSAVVIKEFEKYKQKISKLKKAKLGNIHTALTATSSTTTASEPSSSSSTPASTEATIAPSTSSSSSLSSQPLTSLDMAASAANAPLQIIQNSPEHAFDLIQINNNNEDPMYALAEWEPRPLNFRNQMYLAPLTTVGNLPFRRLCIRLGCDITCGEMALATSVASAGKNEWPLLRRHKEEKIFGIQLAGAWVDSISRACELINLYAPETNFVDLNCGCPIDQVTQRGMGSALTQPKRITNLEPVMRAMRATLDCPVTIKMRTGWSETERNAREIIPDLARLGITAATLHGRTRKQRYTKLANWEYIRDAADYVSKRAPQIQMIGNGDIYSWQDYEEHMKDSQLATCMIARGALIKPWVFTEIKERRDWDISSSERFELLKSLASFGLEHYGSDSRGVEGTRKMLLEQCSFLSRYIPLGLLERLEDVIVFNDSVNAETATLTSSLLESLPSASAFLTRRIDMRHHPVAIQGRDELETLMASPSVKDWIKLTEMILGPAPKDFVFTPKHKSNAYEADSEEAQG